MQKQLSSGTPQEQFQINIVCRVNRKHLPVHSAPYWNLLGYRSIVVEIEVSTNSSINATAIATCNIVVESTPTIACVVITIATHLYLNLADRFRLLLFHQFSQNELLSIKILRFCFTAYNIFSPSGMEYTAFLIAHWEL